MNHKFKIGQTVICVKCSKNQKQGAGWKKDYVFKIASITSTGNSTIYWPYMKNGVYEYALRAYLSLTEDEINQL